MKRTMVAAVAVGSLLLVAACSSSNKAAKTTTPENTPSSTTSAPTGDPIVLGAIGGYTGNQAASNGLVDDASMAWEKSVNARGGINGHPVKLIIKDDGADPAKALQAQRQGVPDADIVWREPGGALQQLQRFVELARVLEPRRHHVEQQWVLEATGQGLFGDHRSPRYVAPLGMREHVAEHRLVGLEVAGHC